MSLSRPRPAERRSTAGLALLAAVGLVAAGLTGARPAAAQLALGPDPQEPLTHLQLEVWQVPQGLPQNTVTALLRTRDGYLWFGSEEGLTRFNGIEFRVFDQDNTASFVPSETIRDLLETGDGTLWVATRQGVVRVRDGRPEPFPLGAFPRPDAHELEQTPDGALWVGTADFGLLRCTGADEALRCLRVRAPGGTLDARIQALLALPDGSLWVGTERGLLLLRDGRARRFTDGLPDPSVLALTPARAGGIWVGTRGGAARVRAGAVEPLGPAAGWPAEAVWALAEDADGALWLGLDAGGILRHHRGRFDRLSPEHGFPPSRVLTLLHDYEGNVWVGTEAGGLVRLRDSPFATITPADGLASPVVLTVFEDGRGRLWTGTDDGTLHRIRPGAQPEATAERRFPRAVSALAATAGALWVGTLGDGLHRRRDDGTWIAYNTADGLPSDFVYALFTAPSGDLWVGTDAGLARLDGGHFRLLTTADGLSSNVVTAVLEDRRGRLWVGTYDGGLNRVEGGRVTAQYGADVLGSTVVSALHEDADGALWVGTYGGGLVRFGEGASFRFTPRHGLFDDKIYQILEDADGRFWMGCNKGVFRVDRAALDDVAEGRLDRMTSTAYDEGDGMRSREVMGGAQPAGWRSRDGRIWFPTTAGLAVVDPAALERQGPTPPVVIEEVRVERVPVVAWPGMRLPPSVEHVEFAFAGLHLADPEAVRYRYRLEGYEETWSDPIERRVVTYTHLDPGDYTFRVQAVGQDGAWDEQGTAFAFTLRPFFWETVWFWLLVGLAGAGVGVAGYRARVQGLKRRQRQLQDEVDARTSDLRAALDEREVLLREIHHRVKNNLQIVSSLLHLQAQKDGDAETAALFREARTRVHAMAMIHEQLYRSDRLAFLDFGAYLRAITEQLARSYGVGPSVHLDVRADEAALTAEQAVPLGLITNELVSNALKHAYPDRHVRLLVRFEHAAAAGCYRLAVEDDGPGLPPDFRPEAGSSLGLKLVNALAARLGGTLSAGPAEAYPTGARFTLQFPLYADAPAPAPPAAAHPVGTNGTSSASR